MSRASVAVPNIAPNALLQPLPAEGNASTVPVSDQSGADRRAHKRHTTAEVPFVVKIRLKYGPEVTLIDLSTGGAQIEAANFRLQPGSTVVLEIAGADGELSIPAKVVRCQLTRLLPEPIYRGALMFKRALDFKALAPGHAFPDSGPVTELHPSVEQARLREVLKRLALGRTGSTPEALLSPIFAAIDGALATLETPEGRRAGTSLPGELAALFKAVAGALEQGPTAAALQSAIAEHLRRVVPSRAIRLAEADSGMQLPNSEAIFLSIPRLSIEAPPARVAVELSDGFQPQELHFQILKAGVQLVAVARELGRLNGADAPLRLRPA